MELSQMQAMRDSLKAARYSGTLTVRAGDKWVTYKSDKELASALAALEREIASLEGRPRKKRFLTYGKKGL